MKNLKEWAAAAWARVRSVKLAKVARFVLAAPVAIPVLLLSWLLSKIWPRALVGGVLALWLLGFELNVQ